MQQRNLSILIFFSRKREKYEDFLKSVKVLQNMDHYERSKLADAIKEEKYNPGDYVIKEVSAHVNNTHRVKMVTSFTL